MSEPIQDPGPAFPRFVPDVHYNGSCDFSGMTLRDYFAAKVLQRMVDKYVIEDGHETHLLARDCYAVADAMIEARKAK